MGYFDGSNQLPINVVPSNNLALAPPDSLSLEAVPWRKIRSRSLQPPMRGRDRPSQRGRGRSLSIHRLIQSRSREPVRPWIEETIRLKPAVITRKVIEREGEQLEAVLKAVKLKPSQIERRQLLREELEKVELKSVQREYLNAVLSQIADSEEIEKDEFRAYIYRELQKVKKFEENMLNKEQLKYSDDISILQLTKQVDELVMRDTLKRADLSERLQSQHGVKEPMDWMKPKSQRATQNLQHTEDMSILNISESVEAQEKSLLQEQPVNWRTSRQQPTKQNLQHTEDSTILNITESLDSQQQAVILGQPVDWRKPRPQFMTQNVQHTEDMSILNVSESFESQQQGYVQEQPINWRTPRQQQNLAHIQHTEDMTLMNVSESMDSQKQGFVQEQPVNWRKPRQQQTMGNLQHTEDLSILNVSESVESQQQGLIQEQPVNWRKPRQQPVTQHTEDMTLMNVSESVESQQQKTVQEQPVNWRKPRQQPTTSNLQHTDDVNLMNVTESAESPQQGFVQEQPVNWRRPRQQPTTSNLQHTEDISLLNVEHKVESKQEALIQEQPVNWRKPRQQPLSNVVQHIDESVNITESVETIKDHVLQELPQSIPNTEEWASDVQVTTSKMQMRPKTVKCKTTDEVTSEPDFMPEFIKQTDVKISSQITKTERRSINYMTDQPLPELELITQKRINETGFKINKENIVEAAAPDELVTPKFIQDLTPTPSKIGAPTKLTCTFVGNPMPQMSWYFNNTELFASENVKFHAYENCGELEIVQANPQLCGIYTCVISNEMGRAVSRTAVQLGKYYPRNNHIYLAPLPYCGKFNCKFLFYRVSFFIVL